MNCIRCGSPLLIGGVCSGCGLDDAYIKKCYAMSNVYYNNGLDKAKVRDLSGAIVDLKKALHMNKHNIEARNLLGLCYHEMGEIAKALSEWVVSANYMPDDNDATEYIQSIQDNPSRLEDINTTIRKYNQTLNYLKNGDYDLASIQLKKVIGMSPNFVNGHLLLALLYIKTDNREKAKKELRRVLRIDVNNTLALRYYSELSGNAGVKRHEEKDKKRIKNYDEADYRKRDVSTPGSNQITIDQYVENSTNKYTFIGIIVGLLVGIAVMYFLFIPQKTDELADSYDTLKQEFNEELSAKNRDITKLQQTQSDLEDEVNDLTKELAKATGESSSGNVFENIINASRYHMDGDDEKAAEYLLKVDLEQVDSKDAQKLYNQLSELILPQLSEEYYSQGYSKMSAGVYEEAVSLLTKAFEYDENNVDALYYLGRTYQYMKKYDDAKRTLQQVIDKFPDSRRVPQAEEHINEMN
ncbi:MAG: tetratricopeptide repeat protein [Lachnospiraceae bacterium]|nr:tetratricopeptide repeat protein [Lachnospiraceae bacterium]